MKGLMKIDCVVPGVSVQWQLGFGIQANYKDHMTLFSIYKAAVSTRLTERFMPFYKWVKVWGIYIFCIMPIAHAKDIKDTFF